MTGLKRLQDFLHAHPTTIPALVLIASLIFFSLVSNNFLQAFNFSLILQQVTVIGIVAIAQTLIILTAGIDLSVGAILVLSSVVMGKLAVDVGLPAAVAILQPASASARCAGPINGLLVTRLKLPPFIVTLGTWNIFFALNLWYSASETIRAQDLEEKAPLLLLFGKGFDIAGARLTLGALLMIGMVALTWYVLNWTRFGRHLYATGDDPDAADLAGVRTDHTLLWVYILAGVICAIAGWVIIGRIGSVSPQAGQTANLDSITAVVIGGTSLFGGRGSIVGTLMGALIVGVFRNGLALSGVNVLWQEFAVGVLIIVAVGLDQWLRRASK